MEFNSGFNSNQHETGRTTQSYKLFFVATFHTSLVLMFIFY
jgi:hypothetical protein